MQLVSAAIFCDESATVAEVALFNLFSNALKAEGFIEFGCVARSRSMIRCASGGAATDVRSCGRSLACKCYAPTSSVHTHEALCVTVRYDVLAPIGNVFL